MIDRGALVVGPAARGPYRGVHRPPLDAQVFTGRRGREIARRYREAIMAGDGVLENLDEALALRDEAAKIGVGGLDVIVFEVPQEPPLAPGRLPLAPTPPAPGLILLGHDVIEPLEPWWSGLSRGSPPGMTLNSHGLLAARGEAEALARLSSEEPDADEPLVAVRVWLCATAS